ncbi:hypothetical protein [Pandoraea sp. CB10b_02]|uniref:hypothetical protein n=1 Tax=Pandoraea sp. CB10b_02 TaxID=2014535 RepID=UPI00257CEEBA|nr:hypothetical protein [Pandoraea sp. CB10b_02]
MKRKTFYFLIVMVLFSMLGSWFLADIGIDALYGNNPFQFFADSNTYIATYEGRDLRFDGNLIGISNNYLGPITVLTLLGGNNYLVLIFNVAVFSLSIIWITRLLRVNALLVGLLLLISPLTVSTLLSVNKEIFVFPFLAAALHSYSRRSLVGFCLAILFAILTRWQLVMFYFIVLVALQIRSAQHRWILIVCLLVAASIAYVAASSFLAPVTEAARYSIDTYTGGGSGLFEAMLSLQDRGLYILAFPIKALHLMFGLGLKLNSILEPVEVYNDLFVGGYCLVMLFVAVCLALRREFTMRSDLFYMSVVFLVIFCATPIFAPRYLYLVYVLWVLMLVGAERALPRLRRRRQPTMAQPPSHSPTSLPRAQQDAI